MSLEMQIAIARKRGGVGMTRSGFTVAPTAPSLPGPAPTPSLPGPGTPAGGGVTGPLLGRPVERIPAGGISVFGIPTTREFGEGER